MDINKIDNKSLSKFPSESSCQINCIHIKIKNFRPIVEEFEEHICDTSWINNLDEISQITFRATSKKTIDKIVDDIIAKVSSNVNTDIGEFIVSYAAQQALEIEHSHKLIPLAELPSLIPFLDSTTKQNIIDNKKGYSAAFSHNNEDIIDTLNNALDSEPIKEIIKYNELYLIAVELC